MSALGLEINDAGIAVADAQRVIAISPGYAWATDGRVVFGESAWQQASRYPRKVQNRFWRDLNEAPLAVAEFGDATAADLVHDHLKDLQQQHVEPGDDVIAAVPAFWSKEQLGRFLGIADELGISVVALIDAAVAASRRCYERANLINVDASLFGATLTRVEQNAQAAVGARNDCASLGIAALERLCVEYFASLFVAQTRFDPLHDAASEQALSVNVYEWLNRLARDSTTTVQIDSGGHAFEVNADYADYAARLGAAVEPALQQLRGLLAGHRETAIQLSGFLMRFPGLAGLIAGLPRAHVFGLETGAGAIGAASRASAFKDVVGHRLHQRLPWDLPAVDIESPGAIETAASATEPAEVPTHAVIGSHAYRLDARPFQIGTQLGDDEYGLAINSAHQGVSRRHCAIVVGNRRIELVDHSRHGTTLNGHTIDGSAILQPGDRISLGVPPVEILLIAEVGRDGA